MLTTQEKTQKVVQILVNTLEFRSAVKKPLINKERDLKTGELKIVKRTGDIEELNSWHIDLKKFENEDVYPDEVNGIMAKVSPKCGFNYHIPTFLPHTEQTWIVIERPNKITWAEIIKRLEQYKQGEVEPNKLVLYLEKNGDFWREPKTKYCYRMGEDSDRYKIVKYLAAKKDFQKTRSIRNKGTKLIRGDIGKIRENIKKSLKLEGKKVIEGKSYSGYRIGILYKIILKN